MNLKDYLTENEISVVEFAAKMNVHYNTIYYIINGRRNPSHKMAYKIQEATNGAVKMEDMTLFEPKISPQLYKFCPTCGKANK